MLDCKQDSQWLLGAMRSALRTRVDAVRFFVQKYPGQLHYCGQNSIEEQFIRPYERVFCDLNDAADAKRVELVALEIVRRGRNSPEAF